MLLFVHTFSVYPFIYSVPCSSMVLVINYITQWEQTSTCVYDSTFS